MLDALYVALVGVLVGGPDSYDTIGAQHFELEVGVIGDRHEPVKEEGVAGCTEKTS
jgi:hypothetical protein